MTKNHRLNSSMVTMLAVILYKFGSVLVVNPGSTDCIFTHDEIDVHIRLGGISAKTAYVISLILNAFLPCK